MEPTPEQVSRWIHLAGQAAAKTPNDYEKRLDAACSEIARLAYAAGADAELEACCSAFDLDGAPNVANKLRAARRPKPPSLKRLATEAFEQLLQHTTRNVDVTPIRAALESLPDD
jgi:hypothetical protein